MHGDQIVISLDAGAFALPTADLAGVVETVSIPCLPGRSGFVTGIISFRNEPVAVIDLRVALGDFTAGRQGTHKVIVARDKGRSLGMDIGASELSFLWDDEIDGGVTDEKGLYTRGRIRAGERTIDIIDWQALFNETARILSTGDHG